jgi:hypothetical protein
MTVEFNQARRCAPLACSSAGPTTMSDRDALAGREAVAQRIWANMAGFYGKPGGWVHCEPHIRLALYKVADECLDAILATGWLSPDRAAALWQEGFDYCAEGSGDYYWPYAQRPTNPYNGRDADKGTPGE